MLKLLLDEHISPTVADGLRRRHHSMVVICMAEWGFLTNHARVLLHIAHDPGARLRDIAASLSITGRLGFRMSCEPCCASTNSNGMSAICGIDLGHNLFEVG